jgi:hypothetical protein
MHDGSPRLSAIVEAWPSLPYAEWTATRDTLHMYTQVIGKLRLALSPFEPGWANVPLYVTARGLTTSPLPYRSRTFEAHLDLLEHVLRLQTNDGRAEQRPLGGSVADFYRDVMDALRRMHIDVTISLLPSEVADPIPFPDDRRHDTYEPTHAARFHRVLSTVDMLMKEHRAGFVGRTTPVHFFWGTFDMALTRFSGRPATPQPDAGFIARFGEDAEEICAGWWPGDERFPNPAFYAYAYPPLPDLAERAIEPAGAAWDAMGEFLLPYDTARSAVDPADAVRAFLRSTYAAAATLGQWDPSLTTVMAPARHVHEVARTRRIRR